MIPNKSNISTSSVPVDDWLDMKYIGKKPPETDGEDLESTNWIYSPSGTVCAQFRKRVIEHYPLIDVITFLDLLNKVWFEIRVVTEFEDCYVHDVDGYYFNSEDELILVEEWDTCIKQDVYKVDYINQKLLLIEKITHEFDCFLDYEPTSLNLERPASKFLCYDGIDYLLITESGRHFLDDENENDILHFYYIYMVPKDPANRTKPIKQFIFSLENLEQDSVKEDVKNLVKQDGEKQTQGDKPKYREGQLLGSYWKIDLTKLEDVAGRKMDTIKKIEQILQKQELNGAYNFVQRGDFYFAATNADLRELRFFHYEPNIGIIYVLRMIEGAIFKTTFLLYPTEMNNSSQPLVLDCKFPIQNFDYADEDNFMVHPHGALLNLNFQADGQLRIRVLKCLRMNLKSLALNKVLFHKDTPIRNHPAYKLCFKGTKPIQYENNETDHSLKRKIPEDWV